jgi:hypothetical protein
MLREAPNATATTATPGHTTGNVPAATALRTLLTAAGIRDPHTNEPFSEAMIFGIAGGIGIGMFSFLYEKADFASFFIAARNDWANDVRYLTRGAERFGANAVVAEGAKPANQAIARALEEGRPSIVWVDAVGLPYKAMPEVFGGMASHVVVLYSMDDSSGTAQIGDLSEAPITIPIKTLSLARARIKKDKHRVMTVGTTAKAPALADQVNAGLDACRAGLLGANAIGNSKTNFSLDCLNVWGSRLHGPKDKDSWERVFTPGARLWRGLTSITDYIEHYGTGGGLSRPLFAEFLDEASSALGVKPLAALAKRYAEIGTAWTELADAALPDDVKPMREAKALMAERSDLIHRGDPDATAAVRTVWQRLDQLSNAAREQFPLSDSATTDLRADLQRRVFALHEAEVAAHSELSSVVSAWR